MKRPKLCNSQVWEQKDFPYFTYMVLMLGHVKGELMFCKVAITGYEGHPLVMTEANGNWMFTEKQMLEKNRRFKYTKVGYGRIKVVKPRRKA